MDRKAIVTKTAKGMREASGATRSLANDLRVVLQAVDGKSTPDELAQRLTQLQQPVLEQTLEQLAAQGYIREVPVAAPPADEGMDLDFTRMSASVPRESELDIRRKAKATAKRWADERAQRHADEEAQRAAGKARSEAEKARYEAERREAEKQAKAAEQAKRAAEELARKESAERAAREAEEREARKAKELAARKAEEQARREAEERARREAEARAAKEAAERARRAAEEQARREAEESERRRKEELARRQAEEAAQRKAEEAAKRAAEEAARHAAEAAAKREAEEAAQRKVEEAAKRAAEEAARHAAEAAAKREAEEAAQRKAEEDAKRAAEEAARHAAEAAAKREAEEAAKRKAEEEAAKREAEEAAKREAEEAAKLQAEETAKREAAEAVRRQEEERKRRDAEEVARRDEAERGRREAATSQEERRVAASAGRRRSLPGARAVMLAVPVLLAGALGTLPFVSFDSQVARFEKAAAARFHQPVTIRAARLSLLLQPHWNLEGVTIGAAEQIRAPQVRLYGGVGSLFDDAPAFGTIEADAPKLSGEGLGWLLLGGARGGGMARIEAHGATLASEILGAPKFDVSADMGADGGWRSLRIAFEGGDLDIATTPENGAARFTARADRFAPPFLAAMPSLTYVKAEGVVGPDDLRVTRFEGGAGGGVVSGSARLRFADGVLEGEASAKNIGMASAIPGLFESGTLDGNGSFGLPLGAPGKAAAPRLSGSFVMRQGSLSGVDLGSTLKDTGRGGNTRFASLTGELSMAGGEARLRELRLSAGPLSARGDVDMARDRSLRGHLELEFGTATVRRRGTLELSGMFAEPYVKNAVWTRR